MGNPKNPTPHKRFLCEKCNAQVIVDTSLDQQFKCPMCGSTSLKKKDQTQYRIKNNTFRKLMRRFRYKGNRREFLLKKFPKNSICAEIGVRTGEFSTGILEYAKPEKLYLIDTWSGGEVLTDEVYTDEVAKQYYDDVIKKFGKNEKVKIVKSRSLEASKQFSDSFFDWIYIDGDHSYEGVKADLEAYFEKVKSGGLITGDDYRDKERLGVIKAVNEFVENYPIKPILFKNYQFILQKE